MTESTPKGVFLTNLLVDPNVIAVRILVIREGLMEVLARHTC